MKDGEKRYKIIKIEKIDKEIDEAKQNAILYAVLSGISSIMTAGFCFNAFYYDNPLNLLVSGIIGSLTIYKMVGYVNVNKEIDRLKKLRDELINEEIKGRGK